MFELLRINLGCACRLLEGYVNVDLNSLEEIKKRYPNIEIADKEEFLQANVFSLPFGDATVDEIRADALLEHFSFKEESQFFYEVKKLLMPGGLLCFSVPDFEDIVTTWLNAKDDWKDFFRDDDEAIAQEHWFGQYSYSTESRWGYIMASIFGPQNGKGQFHKNAYTEAKIRAICKKLDFNEPVIERFLWKGSRDLMMKVKVRKKK